MKTHTSVDSSTKLIYSITVTSASVYDSQVLGDGFQGEEHRV